jgi:hypothetical protein
MRKWHPNRPPASQEELNTIDRQALLSTLGFLGVMNCNLGSDVE